MLKKLLDNAEPAQKILGGLRYVFENRGDSVQDSRRKLQLLLACDVEVKTGKLKPEMALEKLVVLLSCLRQP